MSETRASQFIEPLLAKAPSSTVSPLRQVWAWTKFFPGGCFDEHAIHSGLKHGVKRQAFTGDAQLFQVDGRLNLPLRDGDLPACRPNRPYRREEGEAARN